MSATDIEECVAEYVSAKLSENDFDAEIIGVVISGSRCRGLEGKNSDLDVVEKRRRKRSEIVRKVRR